MKKHNKNKSQVKDESWKRDEDEADPRSFPQCFDVQMKEGSKDIKAAAKQIRGM